jgi:hypothetical protein
MRTAALPFTIRRKEDAIRRGEITSTVETVHGLLRLHGDELVVQWRLARKTERVGADIRTDRELGEVREVAVPLEGVAGAVVRRRWWDWPRGPRLVLTAADLRAFEGLTGPEGLSLHHPARLALRLRRGDDLAGREFVAELALAIAELPSTRRDPLLRPGDGQGESGG